MACEFAGGFAPRERGWWVYSFSTVEIAAAQAQGSPLIVPLSTIPVRQGERWNHIVEAVAKVTLRVDTATSMAAAVAGSQVAGMVTQVSLMDIFGWEYYRGAEVDGRTAIDVMAYLTGGRPSPTPQDIPDADATDVLRTAIIPIRFRPGPRDVFTDRRVMDQIQPLFLFNERSGSAGLRLRLGSALPGAPAGVTDNTVTLCEIYVKTYADKDLQADAPWWARVNRYTQTSFIGLADAAGKDPFHRCLYSMIRHTPEDAVGQTLTDYAAIAVEQGEDKWMSGRSATEMATEYNLFYAEDLGARALNGNGVTFNTGFAGDPTIVDTAAPTSLPLMHTRPGALHSEWGQQPLNVNLTRSASRPDTRVVSYGYNYGMRDEYLEMVAASIGLARSEIAVATKPAASPASGFKTNNNFSPGIIRKK